MPNNSKDFIRFASINIEGSSHLDSISAFLRDFKPDVVCFQELIEDHLAFFEQLLGIKGHFAPMFRYHLGWSNTASPVVTYGIGMFSSLPMSSVSADYYYGATKDMSKFEIDGEEYVRRVLLRATVKKGGESYAVATTHFTKTPDGSSSDKQREDLKQLLALLKDSPEIILCGDFNAPRGGEIFNLLARKYKDNIPVQYKSSLDPKLHRLKNSKLLMVDGLFTTPRYIVTEAELSEGVSDHMAITALISKTV